MFTIKQLSYQYDKVSENALTNVDLEVQAGEVFGLLGPNGAGKTTLISLISGVLPCPADTIFINNNNSLAQTSLSLVPQEYSFYPMLSASENLHFFGAVQGMQGSRLKAAIKRVVTVTGLEKQLSKQAGAFSGGLKRRLNLAIGLLNEPELLLLDEPTVGVDPQSRAFILETIKQLAQAGTTIIYTSHYMEEVEHLCQRIAIMDQGRVLLSGELAGLLAHRRGASVDIHLGPLTQAQRDQLTDQFSSPEFENDIVRFSEFTEELIAHFSAWCVEQEVQINRLHYGPQHLEDLFLMLTKRSLRD